MNLGLNSKNNLTSLVFLLNYIIMIEEVIKDVIPSQLCRPEKKLKRSCE